MDELSVNELLSRVKSGDEQAFSVLCDRFGPLLTSLAEGMLNACESGSRDELLQEARLALYHAAVSYKTEQDEVTFGLYAKICVKNALISQKRRRHAVSVCSLDEMRERGALKDPVSGDDPACRLIGIEEEAKLRERVRAELSDLEYAVFVCYIDGLDTAEIAAVLARPQRSVQNALQRLLAKLRLILR